ncbi:hypothetical protein DRO64_09030, partial [Candidatus Bathyarchaeota archaeon]
NKDNSLGSPQICSLCLFRVDPDLRTLFTLTFGRKYVACLVISKIQLQPCHVFNKERKAKETPRILIQFTCMRVINFKNFSYAPITF